MHDHNEGVAAELNGAQAKRAWSTPIIILSAMGDAKHTNANVGSDASAGHTGLS